MHAPWIDSVKALGLAVVAPALGLQPGRMHSWGPCPACNEARRGSEDKRGALGAAGDGKGWKCHRCQQHGDPLDLVALVKLGKRCDDSMNGPQWNELRTFCASAGWCMETGERPPTTTVDKLMGTGRRTRAGAPAGAAGAGAAQHTDPEAATPARGSAAHEDGPAAAGPFSWREGRAEACAAALWTEAGAQVLAYLRESGDHGGRGLSDEAIKAWSLGADVINGEPWLTIPLRDAHERIVNIRFRSVPPAKKAYRVCVGRPLPLYGVDRLGTDTHASVIVTEGELDVVALWQYGVRGNVVSGTAGASTMKDEWLDELEPYAGFTLCYDDDDAGNAGALAFSAKMGEDRCSRVTLPRKDAGDCLAQGVAADSILRCIAAARPMFGIGLKKVDEYEADLERLINSPEELVGRPTSSKRINQCIGGMRPGLMVITGDTGHGKTTFATWLCWDEATRGAPVLLTSFEQRPIGTVQKLVRMQLGGDFTQATVEQRREALQQLGQMPLHMLDHYGTLPPEKLMNAIRYAARRHGVKTVLVDHLGFLLTPGEDERQQIEAVVRALAVTAYTVGVTIVLICHPKGLAQDALRPTLNDLKGASAIKQDASEVLVVVRDPPRPNAKPPRTWPGTWVYVDKVRSEFGVADSKCLLAFGPLSLVYADDWLAVPEGRSGMLLSMPGSL